MPLGKGGCYVGKVETLALLMRGGVSDDDLLKLPDVRRRDVEKAKQLLKSVKEKLADER